MNVFDQVSIEDGERLAKLIREARERYEAMTPEQKKEHDDAQRASFVRGQIGWPSTAVDASGRKLID